MRLEDFVEILVEICVSFPVIRQNFFLSTSRPNSAAEQRFRHKNSPCHTKLNVTATCSASFHRELLSDVCTPSGLLQRRIGATCRLVCLNLHGLGVSAGDKRSPQSQSPGWYYACVACMWPAFVWTSTKNEWNAQNAIWSRAFRPFTPRNLITRVLTICHVKLTQSTAMEAINFLCFCSLQGDDGKRFQELGLGSYRVNSSGNISFIYP